LRRAIVLKLYTKKEDLEKLTKAMGIFTKKPKVTTTTTNTTVNVKSTVTSTTTTTQSAMGNTREESHNGKPTLGLEDMPREEGEKRVYNLIILDESGSMDCIYAQALSGANETINTIRNAQKDIPEVKQFLTFVTFDSGSRRPDVRAIIKNMPIDQVHDLTMDDYHPSGCTPLYDAMGISISDLEKLVKDGDNVLVTVITDGFENSSRYYSSSMVKELVESLRAKGWVFTYIGANQDSVEVAGGLGIHNSMDFRQDAEGSAMMWKKMNSSRRAYYQKVRENIVSNTDKLNLEEDFFSERKSLERITPEQIRTLGPNEILVFGSDVTGSHSGGLAAYAVMNFGAQIGRAEGPQGQCYAIPTTGVSRREIASAVDRFVEYAQNHPDQHFLVTKIGCGNAGYSPASIAPMFAGALSVENISLPAEFWDVIKFKFSNL